MNEPSTQLISKILSFLDDGKTKEALREVLNPLQHVTVIETAWDLIPLFSTYLTDKQLDLNPDRISDCEKALCYLAKEGNAKELLLAILEQMDSFNCDTKFKTLLKPLQITLQRLPTKRFQSLELTLSTLFAHVSTIPVPIEQNLADDEKMLYDFDPQVQRIGNVTSSLLSFIELFVKELSLKNCPQQIGNTLHWKGQKSRNLIINFLFKFLDQPLACIDLQYNGKSQSTQRACAETIVHFLRDLLSNFANIIETLNAYKFISSTKDVNSEKKGTDHDSFSECSPSSLSVACFSYLFFGENLEADYWPAVFSHRYIFKVNLPCVHILLTNSKPLVILKGLILLAALLNKIENDIFERAELEFIGLSIIPSLLVNVMIFSHALDITQKALELLSKYLYKFNLLGRYWMVISLLTTCDHSGVRSVLINFFKNDLHNSFLNNPKPQSVFTITSLKRILRLIFKLPQGVETDILLNLDQIMGSLNMLRYLLIRDKPQEDITGIWQLLPEIKNDFLKPLRTGLDLSKAHYELEIQRLDGEKMDMNPNSVELFTENGVNIPDVGNESHLQVLKNANITFAMVECILGRVTELSDVKL